MSGQDLCQRVGVLWSWSECGMQATFRFINQLILHFLNGFPHCRGHFLSLPPLSSSLVDAEGAPPLTCSRPVGLRKNFERNFSVCVLTGPYHLLGENLHKPSPS